MVYSTKCIRRLYDGQYLSCENGPSAMAVAIIFITARLSPFTSNHVFRERRFQDHILKLYDLHKYSVLMLLWLPSCECYIKFNANEKDHATTEKIEIGFWKHGEFSGITI